MNQVDWKVAGRLVRQESRASKGRTARQGAEQSGREEGQQAREKAGKLRQRGIHLCRSIQRGHLCIKDERRGGARLAIVRVFGRREAGRVITGRAVLDSAAEGIKSSPLFHY